MIKIGTCLLASLLVLSASAASAAPIHRQTLYPQEKIVKADGYPALVKFIKGDPNKPTIVFVPGDSHLARIAYGFPGDHPKDFLSYWLHKEGYSFLGVSYPIENKVYAKTYPAFTLTDWGKQVADIAKREIGDHHLSNAVIAIGWSMGGKIAPALNIAAKKAHLNLALFIAFSADPPIPGLLPHSIVSSIKMTKTGLADRKPLYPWFVNAVAQQDTLNDHVIIPKKTYVRDFLGNIPIDLMGTKIRYKNHEWVDDVAETLKDGHGLDVDDYPYIAVMHDDSPSDAENVLFDTNDWSLILTRKLYHLYLKSHPKQPMTETAWQRLTVMSKTAPRTMTETIHGDHFFFLGELGAKTTASAITALYARMKNYESMAKTRD